jgi:hypothetical protein
VKLAIALGYKLGPFLGHKGRVLNGSIEARKVKSRLNIHEAPAHPGLNLCASYWRDLFQDWIISATKFGLLRQRKGGYLNEIFMVQARVDSFRHWIISRLWERMGCGLERIR